MRFQLFGFPIRVEWWFWLVAALLGGGHAAKTPDDWQRVAVWVAVVFASILLHELGHAVAARRYGASPQIVIHGMGGATIFQGGYLTRRQNIIMTAAGPAAGLCVALVIFLIAQFAPPLPQIASQALVIGFFVNFFWTLINLLPVLPLDGGQILRYALGPGRAHITTGIGILCSAGVFVWALMEKQVILALLFGMFAFLNWQQRPTGGAVGMTARPRRGV